MGQLARRNGIPSKGTMRLAGMSAGVSSALAGFSTPGRDYLGLQNSRVLRRERRGLRRVNHDLMLRLRWATGATAARRERARADRWRIMVVCINGMGGWVAVGFWRLRFS